MRKKIIAVIVCMIMICMLLPMTAFATGESSMQIGSAGINNQDSVYYGKYTAKYPTLEWNVLDADKTNTNANGMFLITKYALGTGDEGGVSFDNTEPKSNVYQDSDARAWCTGFCKGLAVPEQSAIMVTTESDSSAASGNILNGDKVFFLSAEEADNSAYFKNDYARIAKYNGYGAVWWLRSPASAGDYFADIVDGIGYMHYLGVDVARTARPAFNLNLNSVLFSSAAEGGKSGAVGADGLQQISSNETIDSWKLTLLDTARNNFSAEMTAFNNNTATISYENASVGTDEYISAIITDKDIDAADCNIKYYGRILKPTNANGTATMNLAGKYSDGDKIYIFSEQYNGDKKTDYASPLRDVAVVKEKASGSPDTGNDSNMALWVILAIIAALAAGGTVIARKKKQEN